MTTITEVWSASFRLALHVQHIFANSVNFLITWGLPVTIFHCTCIFCVYCTALYWPTLQFNVRVYRLFVSQYVAPMVSVITTLYYVAIIFHRRVWYRVLSLCYACIWSSGIILTPGYFYAKFCFFHGLHCWASPWKKITYSITHSLNHWPSLCDALGSMHFGITHNDAYPQHYGMKFNKFFKETQPDISQ